MTGTVFNIERFSVHDGPGIRTVVFLKGCPLSCRWCHNPEGISPSPEIRYVKNKCMSCHSCESVCQNGCNVFADGVHELRRESCSSCGICAEVCLTGALTVTGKEYTVEEVIEKVLADRAFYGDKGGMTLSGGEPLMQADFAVALLRSAKENGIHTAVETSGFCPSDILLSAAQYTDVFLYDCKTTDRETHKKYTGVYPDLIGSNLRLLSSIGANIVLRCPIIPTVNDSEKHFDSLAALANELDGIKEIHIEPYNPLSDAKNEQYGKNNTVLFPVMPKERVCCIISYIKERTSKPVIVP